MPSEALNLASQTEKPQHYTYLKEFRTQQCSLFLQHKCTQHRPFSCFHWHFMNQRRRRPIRKRDGTFSYNPDVYCTKYDETSGFCPEGDDCPYLHRTAGDTERRYHLRYYKTCTCVHETDARGNCVKNGAHCAFAHGVHDLRPAVYDSRDTQGSAETSCGVVVESTLSSSLEKDRIINEDPSWNDTNYVLANYKTELCKRPPRLCRQGYACPSYHNTRDKRRSPRNMKYRSTPCPNVKHGDDWGDPTQCENSDACPYCHTRTEQQFHPEIYKSTKCNDMVQTGYCPRGPFCAFAHVEQEMLTQRDLPTPTDNLLGAFFTNVLSTSDGHLKGEPLEAGIKADLADSDAKTVVSNLSMTAPSLCLLDSAVAASSAVLIAGPVGRGRTPSGARISSSLDSRPPGAFGSLRDDYQVKLSAQIQLLDRDLSLDVAERLHRRQKLLFLLASPPLSPAALPVSPPGVPPGVLPGVPPGTSVASSPAMSLPSPRGTAFYPDGETVESVIGNALDEDLNLSELNLLSIEPEFGCDESDNDTVCSTSFSSDTAYVGAMSVPVTIPSRGYQRAMSVGSADGLHLPPAGSLSPPPFCFPLLEPQQIQQQQKQEQQLQEAAVAFLSQPNPGKYAAPSYVSPQAAMSLPTTMGGAASPLLTSLSGGGGGGGGGDGGVNGYNELHRLQEELAAHRAKLTQWQDGMTQARSACEAWKNAVEESGKRARQVDDEREVAVKQRDEALAQLTVSRRELELVRSGQLAECLQARPNALPLSQVQQLRARLRLELDSIDKLIYQQTVCMLCGDSGSVAPLACQHCAVCDACRAVQAECPRCAAANIQHRVTPATLPAAAL